MSTSNLNAKFYLVKTNNPKYSVAHWAERNESEQASSEREAREPVKGLGVSQRDEVRAYT